jgi:hypothetical protein
MAALLVPDLVALRRPAGALDYIRVADDQPDPRLGEAIEIVRSRQQPGRWSAKKWAASLRRPPSTAMDASR